MASGRSCASGGRRGPCHPGRAAPTGARTAPRGRCFSHRLFSWRWFSYGAFGALGRTALKPLAPIVGGALGGKRRAAATGGAAGPDRWGAGVAAAGQRCGAASSRQGSGRRLATDAWVGGPNSCRGSAWASCIRAFDQFVLGFRCAQEGAVVRKGDEGAVRAGIAQRLRGDVVRC
jgi:hypothetical protein